MLQTRIVTLNNKYVFRNYSSLDREEMLSTLLYGAEEYGPEESVHIQVGNMFA